MKIKLAAIATLVILGGFAAHTYNKFKDSPTGKVVEQLQERKELIEQFTDPTETLSIPIKK